SLTADPIRGRKICAGGTACPGFPAGSSGAGHEGAQGDSQRGARDGSGGEQPGGGGQPGCPGAALVRRGEQPFQASQGGRAGGERGWQARQGPPPLPRGPSVAVSWVP